MSIFLLVFSTVMLAITTMIWIYVGGEHNAFNTGMFLILTIWNACTVVIKYT